MAAENTPEKNEPEKTGGEVRREAEREFYSVHLQELGPNDNVISNLEARQFDLFRQCDTKDGFLRFSFDVLPGAAILRSYKAGDVIFNLGAASPSAYYIPTALDLARLDAVVAEQTPPEAAPPDTTPKVVVRIPYAKRKQKEPGFWERLLHPQTKKKAAQKRHIHFDGSRDVDVDTRELTLGEGEIFGEMGCISNSPRAAEVRALCDCRLLEIYRPVMTALLKDKHHKSRVDEAYRQRTLDTHLRQLELFCDLEPEFLAELKAAVTLETREGGDVICEQDEPYSEENPPDVFIVRRGMVQVIRNASVSLKPGDIVNWSELCRQICESQPDKVEPPSTPTPAAAPATKPTSALAGLAKKAVIAGPPPFVVQASLKKLGVQDSVQFLADENQGSPEERAAAQQTVLQALNQLLGDLPFLKEDRLRKEIYTKSEIQRKAALFPKGMAGLDDAWSEMELRSVGRLALSLIFPQAIRIPGEAAGPPRVIAYLSRGDCFGEMALVERQPRMATCIATTHRTGKAKKRGTIELVRVPGRVLRSLMDKSQRLRDRLHAISEQKKRENAEKQLAEASQRTQQNAPFARPAAAMLSSPEFHEMGLFQGQRLLVIDLNKCTRCGDCVQACIATHDDHRSRLFLDGPRYDHFLVPSACRNCLNPVCMSDCPVGSIVPGDNNQIEILDWCIGCGVCAELCPYDSIQMHDLGVIPEDSQEWEFSAQSPTQTNWQTGGGKPWLRAEAPIRWTADFLSQWQPAFAAVAAQSRLFFRHKFKKTKAVPFLRLAINCPAKKEKGVKEEGLSAERWYNIAPSKKDTMESPTKILNVWLNGQSLSAGDKPRWNAQKNFADLAASDLKSGDNWIAVEVEVQKPPAYNDVILTAYLDKLPEAHAQTEDVLGKQSHVDMKLASVRAVVCDLCSGLPGQNPACVTCCPHDAAIRVNPLVNFPI